MPAVLLHVVTVETRVMEIGKRFGATLRQTTLPNVPDLSRSWMKASAFHAKQQREASGLLYFRYHTPESIFLSGISWRTCCDGFHEYLMLMSIIGSAIAPACRTGEHQKAFLLLLLIELYHWLSGVISM